MLKLIRMVITDDVSDNIFLDAALAADAQFIVSGDRHLLNLREFKGISILSARDFLKELSSEIAENIEE
jgi:predicted nucleic acid-binding protein